jgi:hypothetical protein
MSENNIQNKITEEFRKNVLKWITLDDTLRELRGKVKEITNEKKQYEEFVLSFLENVDEKSIEIKDGKLSRNVSKTKSPLKKELIFKSLSEITNDPVKAKTMTEHILENRPMVERINLKRTKNRNNNSNQ